MEVAMFCHSCQKSKVVGLVLGIFMICNSDFKVLGDLNC